MLLSGISVPVSVPFAWSHTALPVLCSPQKAHASLGLWPPCYIRHFAHLWDFNSQIFHDILAASL